MSRLQGLRLFVALAPILLAGFGLMSCSRDQSALDGVRVKADFEACRTALLNRRADEAVRYLPQNVDDYFASLNSGNPNPPVSKTAPVVPQVDLLLRTALSEKVPREVRPQLTLETLLQRLADRGLLSTKQIRNLSIGPVVVQGDRASAELYFQGRPLPVRLPFVKQAQIWKIDLLAMLPFAEVLMRLDRAITGKTASEQVTQLVRPLPIL